MYLIVSNCFKLSANQFKHNDSMHQGGNPPQPNRPKLCKSARHLRMLHVTSRSLTVSTSRSVARAAPAPDTFEAQRKKQRTLCTGCTLSLQRFGQMMCIGHIHSTCTVFIESMNHVLNLYLTHLDVVPPSSVVQLQGPITDYMMISANRPLAVPQRFLKGI